MDYIKHELAGAFYNLLAFALIPVTASGCCAFAFLAPPDFLERATAVYLSLGGIIGTIAAAVIVVALCRRASPWRAIELGRNIFILLVCIAWCLGAVGGVLIFMSLQDDRPNLRPALDAATASSSQFGRHWRGASEAER